MKPSPNSGKPANNKLVRPGINLLLILLLVFLSPACSRANDQTLPENKSAELVLAGNTAGITGNTSAGEADNIAETPIQFSEPYFVLIPERARPGEPVTIAYGDNFAGRRFGYLQAVLIDSRERRITKAAFFYLPTEDGEIMAAILAIPSTALAGNAVIRIESGDGILKDLPYIIESREFVSETIPLNQQNTDLRTVPDPQKTEESNLLYKILSTTGKDIYGGDQFMPPVSSTRRTSYFGDRRVYRYADNSSDTSIHAGIDYGVPTGTEVRACAAGKAVLARPRIVTGNSVILEHLPGIYSLYYHMDSISITEGTVVETGALLGLSGSTGLATGPHLHWEIRVSGENADPDAFISRAVLDKKDILNKIRDNLSK